MPGYPLIALFLIAACALSTGARAENTYRCGNSYSQLPCPGATLIDTSDPRSGAQKLQTDLATARDAKVADEMEAARLVQDKLTQPANLMPGGPTTAELPATDADADVKRPRHAKKKASGFFTAQVPGEKKKKTAVRKKAKTKKPAPA